MINPSLRPLPDNTQHSQQTEIHAPGGIRTHDHSRRAALDLAFTGIGPKDICILTTIFFSFQSFVIALLLIVVCTNALVFNYINQSIIIIYIALRHTATNTHPTFISIHGEVVCTWWVFTVRGKLRHKGTCMYS